MSLREERDKEEDVRNQRATSPEPSCVSVKSKASMNKPSNFSDKSETFDPSIPRRKRQRAASPEPSCVSVKSKASMNKPSNFSDKSETFDPSISRRKRQRAASPEPSCVFMKSDRSMHGPFREETFNPRLAGCHLSERHCESLSSTIQSSNSHLRDLDLSNNDLQDSGVKMLSVGLKSSDCQLNILRLAGCRLTGQCCENLVTVVQSSSSCLRELDLSNNDLQDYGLKLLSAGLMSPHCQLSIMRLVNCNLTGQCCKSLSSVLQSSDSHLRELDLSNNDLQDSGVNLLSAGLKISHCQLNILRLSGCMVTEEGCSYVSSALSSNPSHLRELDLSYNHPGDSGVKLLSEKLNHPNYRLDEIKMDHGGEFRITAGLHKYACFLTLDPNTTNTHLILSEENRKVTHVREKEPYSDHPDRFDECPQVLCRESLSGRCYWEAELIGRAVISVAYKGLSRKGWSNDCVFGRNENSWCLICSVYNLAVRHNNKFTDIRVPSGSSKRVGVYVDVSAGTLSFYSISDTHTLTHLHTFNTTFTESLHAGFGFYDFNSSVTLCQSEQQQT